MATTEFTVTNLQDIYEFPYGFFVTLRSEGGVDTQGTEDPVDDVTIPTRGVYNNDDARGQWVDLKNPFEVEGDVAVVGSQAEILFNYLNTKEYQWYPSNPAYDTVAPLSKDGVTANPNFDPSGNPLDLGGASLERVGEMARHFTITTIVTP